MYAKYKKELKTFGAALRERRKALGLTETAFAEVLGIKSSEVGCIEDGRKYLTLGLVKRITDASGVRYGGSALGFIIAKLFVQYVWLIKKYHYFKKTIFHDFGLILSEKLFSRFAIAEKDCRGVALNHAFERTAAIAYSLGMMQSYSELKELCELLRNNQITSVLEIGTGRGGALYCWGWCCQFKGDLVTVDMSPGEIETLRHDNLWKDREKHPWAISYPPYRKWLYKMYSGNSITTVHASSVLKSTYDRVAKIPNGRKVDLLMIDGDPSYAGMAKEYEMYRGFVKAGGFIVIHDIAGYRKDFWNKLKKDGLDCSEIMHHPENGFGYGILRV